MATNAANPMAADYELSLDGPLTGYWIALLRVIVGWWFFHAGVTKLMTDGLNFKYGNIYLEQSMLDTVLGPLVAVLVAMPDFVIAAGVPVFETLIGLALIVGVATRLASVGGMFFMTLFWVGNADFGHGVVNGDLMGLLLFGTMIVLAAGRYYGVDAILEQTKLVKDVPRLRYLLG